VKERLFFATETTEIAEANRYLPCFLGWLCGETNLMESFTVPFVNSVVLTTS
jgi:hypothetical protein